VIPKTNQTSKSMHVVNFEIHLLPNCNCFLLQVFSRLWYTLDTTNFAFSHVDFAHSFSMYGAWNETKMEHRLNFLSHCSWRTIFPLFSPISCPPHPASLDLSWRGPSSLTQTLIQTHSPTQSLTPSRLSRLCRAPIPSIPTGIVW
jgi:hypothetical protein